MSPIVKHYKIERDEVLAGPYFVDESKGKTLVEYFNEAEPFKPLQISRKMYRQFLEDSGIVSELTKILYKVVDMKEKPPYFLHFFKTYFGETAYDIPNYYRLKQELESAQARLKELQDENGNLKRRICCYENYWELKPFYHRY